MRWAKENTGNGFEIYRGTIADVRRACRLIPGHRPLLFHGTRFARKVVNQDTLAGYDGEVCLSRNIETAAYWAGVGRDDDEGIGALLCLCRDSLSCRHRIYPAHDPVWDLTNYGFDEAEERVPGIIRNVRVYLVGLAWMRS